MTKFGLKNLKSMRNKYFLTQYDVCKFINVSDVAYRTWENGVRIPREKHLDRLYKVFDILEKNNDAIDCREMSIEILNKELYDAID